MTDDLRRHALPGTLAIDAGPGGLVRLAVENPFASAEVFLHGGHVARFQPRGAAPVLFLAPAARFAPDQPIRGGIPLCWPWFSKPFFAPDAQLPMHGFVRTLPWRLAETATLADGATRLVLALADDARTRALWPHAFALELEVTIGAALRLRLTATNTGDRPFAADAALHTYLAVGDVRRATVEGLAGHAYLDKPAGLARRVQEGAVAFGGEVDRVYLPAAGPTAVVDPVWSRRIAITPDNGAATVVWNPGQARGDAMADLGAGAWTGFCCVETAACHEARVQVLPGASHRIGASYAIAAL